MSPLDPVQLAALKFAEGKPGVGWFMEQGLGKTLTALAEFDRLGKAQRSRSDDRHLSEHLQTRMGTTKSSSTALTSMSMSFDRPSARRHRVLPAAAFDMHERFHPPVMIFNYEAARMTTVLAGTDQMGAPRENLSGD